MFPIENGDIPARYASLPEGSSSLFVCLFFCQNLSIPYLGPWFGMFDPLQAL